MPVFTIGTPSGHQVDIEAADEATAIKGAQAWYSSQKTEAPNPVENALNAPVAGAANVVGGFAKTAQALGLGGKGVADAADAMAPKGYESATAKLLEHPIDNISSLPRAVAENTPDLAGAILAAKGGKAVGGKYGALAAAALYGMGRTFGQSTEKAAETGGRTLDTANAEDKLRGAGSALLQGGLNTIAPARLVGAIGGKATGVGLSGVGNALTRAGTTTVIEAGTNAAQNAADQLITTGNIKPNEVGGSAILGGATAATPAGAKGLKEGTNAVLNRHFTPDLHDASSSFANLIQEKESKLGAMVGGGKRDFEAVSAAQQDVINQLKDVASQVQKTTPLGTEADNALNRAIKGERLTPKERAAIDTAVAADPNGANLSHLVKQATVAKLIEGRGNFDRQRGTFSGGASAMMERGLRVLTNPFGTGLSALGAGGAAVALPVTVPYMGAAVGAYAGARVLDHLTGMRSPAKTFVDHFANPNTPTRVTPVVPPPNNPGGGARPSTITPPPGVNVRPPPNMGQGPWGPWAGGPTGPGVAQAAPAWQSQVLKGLGANLNQYVGQRNTATAKANTQLTQLQQLVANQAPPQAPKAPVAPPAPAVDPVFGMPVETLKAIAQMAKNIEIAKTSKDKILGQQQADAEINASPLVNETASPQEIKNPTATKEMGRAVSAIKALQKLRSSPEEEAAAREDAQAAKEQVKAEKAQARAEAKAAKEAAKPKREPKAPKAPKGGEEIPKFLQNREDPANGTPIDVPNFLGKAKGPPSPIEVAKVVTKVTKGKNGKVSQKTVEVPKPATNGQVNGNAVIEAVVKGERARKKADPLEGYDLHEVFPPWEHADLPIADKARKVLDERIARGDDIRNPKGYLRATAEKMQYRQDAAEAIAGALPTAREKYVAEGSVHVLDRPGVNRATAKEVIAEMKRVLPKSSHKVIDHWYSDASMLKLWPK